MQRAGLLALGGRPARVPSPPRRSQDLLARGGGHPPRLGRVARPVDRPSRGPDGRAHHDRLRDAGTVHRRRSRRAAGRPALHRRVGLDGQGIGIRPTDRGPRRLPDQRRSCGAGEARRAGDALSARLPRQGDRRGHLRGARRHDLHRGGEPPPRPEVDRRLDGPLIRPRIQRITGMRRAGSMPSSFATPAP